MTSSLETQGRLSALDRPNSYYYLVPWRTKAGITAQTQVDARFGVFESLHVCESPGAGESLPRDAVLKLIGSKAELFELPAIGLTVLMVNTILGFVLHRWERPATYGLGAFALLVQVLLWVAIISLMG